MNHALPDQVLKELIPKIKRIPPDIYNRAAEFCMRPVQNIEPIQMVRYTYGQFYKPHHDYLDTKIDLYKQQVDLRTKRNHVFV